MSVTHPGPVTAGGVLMAMSTASAVLFRAPHIPSRAAIVIPLIDILAVGPFRAGTGGPGSVFTIMLVLPVISLGVEPGRLPMLLGAPGHHCGDAAADGIRPGQRQ